MTISIQPAHPCHYVPANPYRHQKAFSYTSLHHNSPTGHIYISTTSPVELMTWSQQRITSPVWYTRSLKMQSKPPRRRVYPWYRRANIWDPPTALDKFISSPIAYIISYIHILLLHLRGAPFQPSRTKPRIRIVCISDTHTNTTEIPDGDLLIHAGDLTNAGTVEEIQAQIDWLDTLPHREKIVIAGNHDSFFDIKSRQAQDQGREINFKSLRYLENESVTLVFEGGRELNCFGSPDIPKCGGSDFA